MDMKTRTNEDGDIAILELEGRFDAFEVGPVKDWLNQAAGQPSARIIVDLTNVNFVDSSGLATFVQVMKRCRQHNGDLVLCGLQQSVQMIFNLTRLDRAFKTFSDVSEALQALKD